MAMAKEFVELAIDGHNYPTWASDIKINFASRGLLPTAGVVLDEQKKYGALMIEVLNPKGSKRRVPYGGEPLSSMASV
jgi:hypothetical protein